MTSGVYRIWNPATGDFYVGSSKNIELRFGWHIKNLVEHKHHNYRMQAAFDAGARFKAEILQKCSPFDVEKMEQRWITKLHPTYNIYQTVKRPGRKNVSRPNRKYSFWNLQSKKVSSPNGRKRKKVRRKS